MFGYLVHCDVEDFRQCLQSGLGNVLVHDRSTFAKGFQISTFRTSVDKVCHVASGFSWFPATEAIELMRLAFDLGLRSVLAKCFDASSMDQRWFLIIEIGKFTIFLPAAHRAFGNAQDACGFIHRIASFYLDLVPFEAVLGHVRLWPYQSARECHQHAKQ